MVPTVRFGDVFKISIPTRSLDELEKKFPLTSNVPEHISRKNFLEMQHGGQIIDLLARYEKDGFVRVPQSFVPSTPNRKVADGFVDEITLYMVTNGPESNDLDDLNALSKFQKIIDKATEAKVPVSKSFGVYVNKLKHDFLGKPTANDVPELPIFE